MSIPTLPIKLSPALSGRDAIADAIYRCVDSFDRRSMTLLNSSFTDDAVFEINGRRMEGIQAITDQCFAGVSKLDTTHHVTNLRINVLEEESKAEASCSALAQHFPAGEGLKPGVVPLLVGSLYWIELIKDTGDELWKIKKFILTSNWAQGDWGVFGN